MLSHVHAWYALAREDGGWIFGPSKFVGYPDNSAKEYLRTYRKDANGGQTELVLREWYQPVRPDSKLERELMAALEQFLANWERAPRKAARISVVTPDDPEAGALVATSLPEALLERIAINPRVLGGRPCIRGTRVRVSDILDMLASGATKAEILTDYPYLTADDISAALAYAAKAADHRVIRAA
jgi:uncharacterized protein (DUF433 family)